MFKGYKTPKSQRVRIANKRLQQQRQRQRQQQRQHRQPRTAACAVCHYRCSRAALRSHAVGQTHSLSHLLSFSHMRSPTTMCSWCRCFLLAAATLRLRRRRAVPTTSAATTTRTITSQPDQTTTPTQSSVRIELCNGAVAQSLVSRRSHSLSPNQNSHCKIARVYLATFARDYFLFCFSRFVAFLFGFLFTFLDVRCEVCVCLCRQQ